MKFGKAYNMNIRKISIGPDYKGGAMHYIVGQQVLGGSYTIHLIQNQSESGDINIWIEGDDGIVMWKRFTSTMPISIEYNINF